MKANIVVQLTIEKIAVEQHVQLLIPTIICTAFWETYVSDFRDTGLVRREGVDLSRAAIAQLSQVLQELYDEDILVFRKMLLHRRDAVRNMTVLQVIHLID